MISKAIYDYLTSTAPMGRRHYFRRTQSIDGLQIASRDDAKRHLLDRVGTEIHHGRTPEAGSKHTAITIRTLTTTREQTLWDDHPIAESIVQFDVWTRGANAGMRGEMIGALLRLALSNFYADRWGDVLIKGTSVERDGLQVQLPRDGSDGWSYVYSFDLLVMWVEPAVQLVR